MSATDELRRLLDEHGVEYKSHYLHTSWYAGMKLYMATPDANGTLSVDNLTPEQAIAATLNAPEDNYRQAAGYWRRMYEEAFAERTCECVAEYVKSPIDGKTIVLHRCSACHELMRPHMAYCPNCGAKVVSE